MAVPFAVAYATLTAVAEAGVRADGKRRILAAGVALGQRHVVDAQRRGRRDAAERDVLEHRRIVADPAEHRPVLDVARVCADGGAGDGQRLEPVQVPSGTGVFPNRALMSRWCRPESVADQLAEFQAIAAPASITRDVKVLEVAYG